MQILMQFWQLTGLFLTSFVCKNALIIFVCIRFMTKTTCFGRFWGSGKTHAKNNRGDCTRSGMTRLRGLCVWISPIFTNEWRVWLSNVLTIKSNVFASCNEYQVKCQNRPYKYHFWIIDQARILHNPHCKKQSHADQVNRINGQKRSGQAWWRVNLWTRICAGVQVNPARAQAELMQGY